MDLWAAGNNDFDVFEKMGKERVKMGANKI